MKDILNLFRRDAEHEHHDIGKENLGTGMKGTLLGRSAAVGGGGGGVSVDNRGTGMRIQPGVMEKAGAGLKPRDEGIYGRRW